MDSKTGQNPKNPATAGILAAVTVSALLLGAIQPVRACFYNSYWFDRKDNSQTSVRKLVYGDYTQEERSHKTPYYLAQLKTLSEQLPRKQDSPEFMEDYAYVLYRVGHSQEAERVWVKLLQEDPTRYTALCSLATACQLLGRYDDATTMLARAIRMRPGFRHHAEEYHLKMVQYMILSKTTPGEAQAHLFLDELTPLWVSKRLPPGNLAKVDFPDLSVDGVAELVRQFPTFGEGWLVLAILLEHEEEYSLAKIAYQKALKAGTSQSPALKNYLQEFAEFEKTKSRVRLAGREVLKLIILLCLLAVLYWFRAPLARLSTFIARRWGPKKKQKGKEKRR